VGCAYAGDTLEDANFTMETANAAILRLYTAVEWAQEATSQLATMREGPPSTFSDKVFESQINLFIQQCDADYERMNYRNVVVSWHSYKDAKDNYVLVSDAQSQPLNRDLILRYIRVLAIVMAPILSHMSEYIWRTILKNPKTIFNERFPDKAKVDMTILRAHDYINRTIITLRSKLGTHNAPPKKKTDQPLTPAVAARIYFCSSLPDWQQETIRILKKLYEANNGTFPSNNDIATEMKKVDILVKNMKKVMPFANNLKEEVNKNGPSSFDLALPFNELEVINQNLSYIRVHGLGGIAKLTCFEVTEEDQIPENVGKKTTIMPEPGKPLVFFDSS